MFIFLEERTQKTPHFRNSPGTMCFMWPSVKICFFLQSQPECSNPDGRGGRCARILPSAASDSGAQLATSKGCLLISFSASGAGDAAGPRTEPGELRCT